MQPNLLTIDFERLSDRDIYPTQRIPPDTDYEYTSESLRLTLELLDRHETKATFFTLGEIADKHPEFLRQINENGHELALHGWCHDRLDDLTPERFAEQLELSFEAFNRAVSRKPVGFRAPQFSMNRESRWVLRLLAENGFRYDSSIYPCNLPFYGSNKGTVTPYYPSYDDTESDEDQQDIIEFPALILQAPRFRMPIAGGFWLRLLGLGLAGTAIRSQNRKGHPAVIYLHNWELLSPAVKTSVFKYRYRNYGIPMVSMLDRLLDRFRFTSVQRYLDQSNV